MTYYTPPLATCVCVFWQDASQPTLRNLPTHDVQATDTQPQPVEDVPPHEVKVSAAPQPVEDLPPSKRTQLYLKEAAAKRKAEALAPVAEQKQEQKGHTSDEPARTDEAPAHPSTGLAKPDPAPETHSQGNAETGNEVPLVHEPPPAAQTGNEVPLVNEPTLPTAAPESLVNADSSEKGKPTDEPTTNQEPVDQTLGLLESLGEATTQAVLGQAPELSTLADQAPEPSTTADTPGPVSQTLVVESLPRPAEEPRKDTAEDQLIDIEDRTGYNGYGDGCIPENQSHSLDRIHLVSAQWVN